MKRSNETTGHSCRDGTTTDPPFAASGQSSMRTKPDIRLCLFTSALALCAMINGAYAQATDSRDLPGANDSSRVRPEILINIWERVTIVTNLNYDLLTPAMLGDIFGSSFEGSISSYNSEKIEEYHSSYPDLPALQLSFGEAHVKRKTFSIWWNGQSPVNSNIKYSLENENPRGACFSAKAVENSFISAGWREDGGSILYKILPATRPPGAFFRRKGQSMAVYFSRAEYCLTGILLTWNSDR